MSDQRLTSKLGHPTDPKYNTSAAATKNTSPNNFFIFCLHFLFLVLELSDTDPSRPYMNHYSRGIFQEQALLPIWSISLSKWLNSCDKRKRSPDELLDFADYNSIFERIQPSFSFPLTLEKI